MPTPPLPPAADVNATTTAQGPVTPEQRARLGTLLVQKDMSGKERDEAGAILDLALQSLRSPDINQLIENAHGDKPLALIAEHVAMQRSPVALQPWLVAELRRHVPPQLLESFNRMYKG